MDLFLISTADATDDDLFVSAGRGSSPPLITTEKAAAHQFVLLLLLHFLVVTLADIGNIVTTSGLLLVMLLFVLVLVLVVFVVPCEGEAVTAGDAKTAAEGDGNDGRDKDDHKNLSLLRLNSTRIVRYLWK